jgi:hypothetical protein
MALGTIGTDATNSLSGAPFNTMMAQADIAQIAANIKNDQVNGGPIVPGSFSRSGWLFVPNRGKLLVQPGDYVVYGSTGWPILLSAAAVAADWTFTP